MTNVEFLKFRGDDVKGMIFICEQFFSIDDIPKNQKKYTLVHKCSGQLYSLVVLADEDEEYYKVEEDDSVAKRFGCPLKDTCPLAVIVGGGKQLISTKELSKELPPQRSYDHRISLLEGTQPINIRPYRHPSTQKDAIEAMLDLSSGYYQIRMCEEDIAKKAFNTHEGHYEFLIMPFGLTNTPSTFQALTNEIFKAFLRKFTLVFFDDILVYSQTMEEHAAYLQMVLETIRRHKLYAKLSKSVFRTTHVEYLGYVISKGLPDFNEPFVIDTDVLGVGLGVVLQQKGHPIAYLSKTLSPKHQSMSTYEKEFLAVLMALESILKGLKNGAVDALSKHGSSTELLMVGQDEGLRKELLQYFYEDSIRGHSDVKVTSHRLCSLFYWKGMRKQVKQFVRECLVCQKCKPDLSAYPREEAIQMIKFYLQRSQNRIKQQADKSRSEREFDIGDMVFLKLQPHRQVTIRMGKQNKFSQKFYGLFEVSAKVGQAAYKLKLHAQAQIHNVFHVSQLKRKMVKKNNKMVVYGLVQWANGTVDDASWEDLGELVEKFPKFDLSS
nr:retrotransposon protein, putative, unclassified [Tanacetum cinerariifolium]